MDRISELFRNKNKKVLNVYCTAGFPRLESTLEVMKELQDNGVDIIELGMPYSDPLADGPVIQESNTRAIANGMTTSVLFSQLKDFRKHITIPVVLMGYMNTVMQYGFERFCKDAAEVGIDGLILPDLPVYEFESTYREIIRENGLHFIFLVTPETSAERIKKIDSLSSGFLYAVSSSSTTGKNTETNHLPEYLQRLQSLHLQNPVLVGFGISDSKTFNDATAYSRGAVIGSAYIRALGDGGEIKAITKDFVDRVRPVS
ncbi:MAG TPA: tryptophan synthase subunit alpha [Parasegetibacter sp.]|jgi:tryptophan synthase alpha chain